MMGNWSGYYGGMMGGWGFGWISWLCSLTVLVWLVVGILPEPLSKVCFQPRLQIFSPLRQAQRGD